MFRKIRLDFTAATPMIFWWVCVMIRLNKYLSDAGVCSRREGDRLIEAGRVSVDKKRAVVGMQISEDAEVLVDNKPVRQKASRIYLAYHKPRGIVCTFEKKEKHNLLTSFQYPERVTYAGRLDKESEGLLVMTNDGDLIDRMMRARNGHEKEYVVRINQEVTEAFLGKMRKGVYLPELEVKTRPCRVRKSGECEFHIVLTQGLNRQIRRMCEALGCKVVKLKRIRVVNIMLGSLPSGDWRELNEEELRELKKRLERI